MGGTRTRAASPRVVVTGLGAVSPLGRGRDALWRGLAAARTGIGPFELFDASEHRTHVAGEIRDVDLEVDHRLPHRQALRLTRTDRFALSAAFEAVGHGDLGAARAHVGVFFGSSTGGMFEGEEVFEKRGGPMRGGHTTVLSGHQMNSPADSVARALRTTGPIEVHSSACSASTMAIEGALQALRAGEVDVALAGGSDGLCRLTYAGFNSLRAVDERPCRPFRADREGLSIGEGAGVLLLETLDHARARGAAPLAELAGAGSTCDAFHMTAPDPEGAGAAAAIRCALADGGLAPDDVDFVNLHGTGTPHNDAAEWRALASVFGERAGRLPATSTKSSVGHLLGGSGGLEAVATLLCLDAGCVHPTTGEGPVDPDCPADIVFGEPRELSRCEVAVTANLAFGGANAALVFRKFREDGA